MALPRDFVMPPKSCCSLSLSSELKLRAVCGRLRAADPDSDQEHQRSPDNHLKCGAKKWRVHISVSNPANEQKFNCHDHNGNSGGSSKIWNQIWQGVTNSSCLVINPQTTPRSKGLPRPVVKSGRRSEVSGGFLGRLHLNSDSLASQR
jgi:hypothetical protein